MLLKKYTAGRRDTNLFNISVLLIFGMVLSSRPAPVCPYFSFSRDHLCTNHNTFVENSQLVIHKQHPETKVWMASELDETIKRISSKKGVEGVIIINSDGIPIRTSLDEEQATIYAGICSHLVMKGKSLITGIDPSDELRLLRLRSKKYELLLAPDKGYLMVVIQKPQTD